MNTIQGKIQNSEGDKRLEDIRREICQHVLRKIQIRQVLHANKRLRSENANLVLSQHEEAKIQEVLNRRHKKTHCCSQTCISISDNIFQTHYLESPWRKVCYTVVIKIQKHQLLCTREGPGVDDLDGISFQVDTLNLWNRSQSTSL